MLLKALNSIQGTDETYQCGDVFTVLDENQAMRLIELGAAVPVRKKITLGFMPTNTDDDLGEAAINKLKQKM